LCITQGCGNSCQTLAKLKAAPHRSDQAIWIAKRCGVPLKIAAKVDAVDRDYFESEIRKLLTPPDVEYIGEISDGEKSGFLSGAIALLAPIAWPEPFGLVLIEAMACAPYDFLQPVWGTIIGAVLIGAEQ
jgi:glycosyltransferase involved in cell wall biosynthesis